MRTVALVSLVAIAGCASAASGPPQSQATHIIGGGSTVLVRSLEVTPVTTLAAPIDRVWRTLPAVFDSLGIPVADLDPKEHIIGNSGLQLHRQLGRTPLTKLLDCGNTQGFPSAETYDISMSVLTQIEVADGDRTNIGTLVEAGGRPRGLHGEVRCASKLELEAMIVAGVKKRLGL